MALPRDPFGPDDEAADAGQAPGEPGEPGDAGDVKRLIPETVKRALRAGGGALFMTEEGARQLARDWKLPKEVVGFVGSQASAAKDEVLRLLGQEVRRFLESETVRKEFLRALSESTVEIRAEIRVRPDGEGTPRPQVKASARRRPAATSRKGRR